MILKSIQNNLPVTDEDFDKIYPEYIQELSEIHWTSVEVARKAAEFLVTKPGAKVLDIGSGVGKFCLIGAMTTPGFFYGVEYRKDLVKISKKIISDKNISNVEFIHSNITDIDFSKYDAFYFYNSFYENLDIERKIDLKIKVSPLHYKEYRNYMYMQLLNAPKGTRVVTYSGLDTEIPMGYRLSMVDYVHAVKFWIKEEETHKLRFI